MVKSISASSFPVPIESSLCTVDSSRYFSLKVTKFILYYGNGTLVRSVTDSKKEVKRHV